MFHSPFNSPSVLKGPSLNLYVKSFNMIMFCASTTWRREVDSKLTVSVPVLDILFRLAHKLSQNSFESAPRFYYVKAAPLPPLVHYIHSRREGDSNPRLGYPNAAFPRRYIQPLCHLSVMTPFLPSSFVLPLLLPHFAEKADAVGCWWMSCKESAKLLSK